MKASRGAGFGGFAGLATVTGVALLLGCAAGITRETPDDVKRDAVAKRAAARWEQVIKGAPGVAYDEYMSKASRRVVSRGQFEGTVSKTAFKTATVEKVECGQDSCKATVVVTYDSRIIARAANVERTIKGIQNTMVESWIIEDGQVWYVWPQ